MLLEFDLLIRAGINIVAALILIYILYYRRYKNRAVFVSAMILNICIFGVMSIITDVNIGLQAGLGLFAILSILRFRSENFDKMDLSYLFAAVAIASVNGIGALSPTIFLTNGLIILVTAVVDSKLIMFPVNQLTVSLDNIPDYLFNEKVTKQELSEKFYINIIRFDIQEIDYVKDITTLKLYYSTNHPKFSLNKNVEVKNVTRS